MTTVRNWDLPDDGAGDQPGDVETWPASEWPAEIVMEGGPNILCQSRAEHDAVRELMAQNARLAARNEP